MRNKHIVYLDCDGVYSDFMAGTMRALGKSYGGTMKWPYGRDGYNFFRLAGSSREEVNELCTIDFFANLPWMEDGRELLAEAMSRFRPDEVMLLTKPMPNSASYTGKAQWVVREIPELVKRLVPTPVSKHEFAFDFNCLLIDDCQDNIEEFTRAGGAGILVPRPWNENDGIFYNGGAVLYVADCMDKWIELVNHPAKNRKE
ncbi:hypothetical protein KAR91_19940 [Candidatus Pacearchaeota archaeon]|nr:hypothetical protein [Candidatus Pacearchaeota archaeon]